MTNLISDSSNRSDSSGRSDSSDSSNSSDSCNSSDKFFFVKQKIYSKFLLKIISLPNRKS